MTRKSAFTMIEMLVALAVTAIIIETVTLMYSYTMERLGWGYANFATQREAENALDTIDWTISNAQSCSIVAVGTNNCLKCVMPANCVAANGDGILNACSPSNVNRRGMERWGTGTRVWFYTADATGSPTNLGTVLWMAKVADDSTPLGSMVVSAWTYYPGATKSRFDLVQSITPISGSTSDLMGAAVAVGSYTSSDKYAPSTAPTNATYQLSMARTAYTRGWRP